MEFPEPVIELFIPRRKTKNDRGKMGEALAKLAEDPTFRAHTDQETD